MNPRHALLFATLMSAVICLTGCPRTGTTGPTLTARDIPNDAGAIISLADSMYERRGEEDAENALFALELGRERFPDDPDIAWRAARVCAWLIEHSDPPRERRLVLTAASVKHARIAATGLSSAVEGHYYLAVSLGLQAQAMTTGAVDKVPEIEAAARKALEIDPSFEEGGPLRLLGMLLVRAPPWPASIGDVEKGVALLEDAATRYPDFPLNRLLLAEALVESAQYERARAELEHVLAAPPDGEWGLIGTKWRKHARALVAEIDAVTAGGGAVLRGDGATTGDAGEEGAPPDGDDDDGAIPR